MLKAQWQQHTVVAMQARVTTLLLLDVAAPSTVYLAENATATIVYLSLDSEKEACDTLVTSDLLQKFGCSRWGWGHSSCNANASQSPQELGFPIPNKHVIKNCNESRSHSPQWLGIPNPIKLVMTPLLLTLLKAYPKQLGGGDTTVLLADPQGLGMGSPIFFILVIEKGEQRLQYKPELQAYRKCV